MTHSKPQLIAPSVLASDWSRLGEEVGRATKAGADWLHMDVMDGQFVENISFGPQFIRAARQHTELFFDTHLMMHRPDHYLDRFIEAGANRLTVHVEAEYETSLVETLTRLRDAGVGAGLAINPATPLERALPYLEMVDLLLVMTVVPGFGGQQFMLHTMDKLRAAKEWRQDHGLDFHLQVDGGIYADTARTAFDNGANVFVVGTYAFSAPDMRLALEAIRF